MKEINTNYVPLVRLHAVRERFLPYGVEESLNTAEKVVRLVGRLLENADREYLLAIAVDTKGKPVGVEITAVGALNVAYVEARETFKHAVLSNSAGLILVHNHPSGEVIPSEADWKLTERMQKAGILLGIELVDHIIVGDHDRYVSLRETEEWKVEKGD